MNISLTNKDASRGLITMEIVKEDYAEQVEKSLRNFRQKANVPGFRKGMVPMGMVKKMYGKHVLVEEVNKLVSDNLYKYIREEKLNILGEPLPNEEIQKPLNFDTDEAFEFVFDVALAPEIDIELNKKTKIPFYQVTIDDDMVEKQVESYRQNFGTYEQVKDVEEKDMIKGLVAELENDLPKEGGIRTEEAVVMPMYIKDEAEKAKFMEAGVNSVVIFNPFKAYEGAEAEIAAFLKIEKDQVAATNTDFSFEIQEITRHQMGELNQELFDKVFGEGVVTTEEEFKSRIREVLAEQFAPQADYKFLTDARAVLVKKAGDLPFADDLLKRWLLLANEKNTPEKIEAEYPQIIEDLKFHLVKETIIRKNDIKVEEADVNLFARRVAKSQFAQYGMLSVPDDILDNYAKDMLKNKETLQNVIDRAVEDKLTAWLKEHVKLDTKEVTIDEFNKLFEE
ncbi:trigger factor [Parabacteroides sp. PFB2-12]|uniref:trigger factor n=1 Tax=unclassified Parabacteroides TaxID=2649774 RepID=UPI002473385F|nr:MULTISPECIES: trigger factor [unclassified Parabacteroides]MDH6342573.1 trigger factor [Parabacteroides sp. PM6-13]MDH6390225.1 trigger factor [Parabacteroides sp. PFB2-12]